MSKFFKAVKTTAITALCAVGMLSMSGCENYGKMLRDTPDEYIDMAMENTMESIGGNTFTEEKKLFEQALEDGSFSLGFEVEGITFNGVCEVSEKANAVSQMYTLSNAEGISAQIYVYADEGGFKFGTSEIREAIFMTLPLKALPKSLRLRFSLPVRVRHTR